MTTEVSAPGTSRRPADVLISFQDDSEPTAIDTSVGHPMHLSSTQAAVTPGVLAAQMEKTKRDENSELCCRWLAMPAGLR